MTENLSAKIKNYALYLPAVSQTYAEYVIQKRDTTAPRNVRPLDLNFLNSRSKLWTYKWCLASAGDLAYSDRSNAITRRDPKSSWILGDSGGYQIGTGALRDTKGWSDFARKPDEIVRRWQKSKITHDILRWLDAHCDYAMTLDMPLWVKSSARKKSPFHYCSVEQLTDMTVENLRYIDKHRGSVGNCKFLNVLQGNDEKEEEYWYRRVREFEFEGWAFGTKFKFESGIHRILKRILLLRDDGMLGGRRQLLHILGVSQLIWAVALTAIQRGIQANTGSPFTVSFDSSTPFLWAGKYQKHPKSLRLTKDVRTWRFTTVPFPVGHAAATTDAKRRFPAGSPLSRRLTLGDMNPDKSPFSAQTFGRFSTPALGNHNTYVFIRAFIDANRKAFQEKAAPQRIADMVGDIAELFECENWESALKKRGSALEATLRRSPSDAELYADVAY